MLLSMIFVLAIFSSLEIASAVRIEITPVKFDGLMATSVNISCTPDIEVNKARAIVIIQIASGEQQMVSVQHSSEIAYRGDLKSVVVADGHIDSDVDKSYLRMTMRHLMEVDSSQYSCLLYYISNMGFMVEEKDEAQFSMETPDLKFHLKYVLKQQLLQGDLIKDQANHIKALETQLKNQDLDAINHASSMEAIISNNTRAIDHLEIKDSIVSSFTAGCSTKGVLNKREVIIFNNGVISEGQGYNKINGLYTAPTKGIYVFHLTAMTRRGHYIQLEIQINGNGKARALCRDPTHWDQSSTSIVVKLEQGDVARVVAVHVESSAPVLHHYPYCLFNGYLLKVL